MSLGSVHIVQEDMMKIDRLIRTLILVCIIVSWQSGVLADRREVRFPISGVALVLNPFAHAFAYNGQLGFALVEREADRSPILLSYSITEGRFADKFDLGPDFGPGFLAMKAHNETGILVFYGLTPERTLKVLAVSSEPDGKLSKRWAAEFPDGGNLALSKLVINRDGSRVYALLGDLPVKLVLLRTEDGLELARTELSTILSGEGTIVFDEARNRPIVELNAGVHVFFPGDGLEIEAVIPRACRTSLAVSQDGRFLLSYGGYIPPETGATGHNAFCSYDLDLKTSTRIEFRAKSIPGVENLILHQSAGVLLVPYSSRAKVKPGGFIELILGRSREADIMTLGPNGLQPGATSVKIPNSSPNSVKPNRILPWNHVAFSSTGALGLVSTDNGRVFAFDTLTGEIVNEEIVDPEFLAFIHLFDPPGLLVAPAGGRIILFDISTGPVINEVKVKRGRTIITGANFLSGARVSIDGEDLGIADRNPKNPGRELTIRRGKKNLPTGQALTLTVVNRDGVSSKPFSFTVQ